MTRALALPLRQVKLSRTSKSVDADRKRQLDVNSGGRIYRSKWESGAIEPKAVPVEEFKFGDEGAVRLSSMLPGSLHWLKVLDLSNQGIGPSGIEALAPAISASASLTKVRCLRSCAANCTISLSCVCRAQVNLHRNKLGEQGWCAIFDALRDNPQNNITKWDLVGEGINPVIVKWGFHLDGQLDNGSLEATEAQLLFVVYVAMAVAVVGFALFATFMNSTHRRPFWERMSLKQYVSELWDTRAYAPNALGQDASRAHLLKFSR